VRVYTDYRDLFDSTLKRGRRVPSRLGMTSELVAPTLVFQPGLLVDRPGMNRALGFMELVLLAAGAFSLDRIEAVAPRADLALFTASSAYGPRLASQIPRVIDLLRHDHHSRQAVLQLADRGEAVRTLPCTSTIQFLVRDDRLETVVTMRSWDLWYGLPYDLVMFGGLALLVARVLRLSPAIATVTAGSVHVYEKHWSLRPGDAPALFKLDPLVVPAGWPEIRDWAMAQSRGAPWPEGVPDGIRTFALPLKKGRPRAIVR
jgi:hypothetical protein